jgi:hypothetical protein
MKLMGAVSVGCEGPVAHPERATRNAMVAERKTAQRKAWDPDFPLKENKALLFIVAIVFNYGGKYTSALQDFYVQLRVVELLAPR